MNRKFTFIAIAALFLSLNIVSQNYQKLIKQARTQEQNGDNASSISTANKIIENSERVGMLHSDSILVMQAYTIKAKNYSDMGDLSQSLMLYKL